MTVQKKRKRLLRIVAAVVLVAALSIGIWFGTQGSGEPVNVYSFQYIGMTEFWGDMQESYGPVVTDKIQTEFLSDTQTVTEVKVKDGDSVKKGDVLFTFDTSLDALSLERKRLEVEKVKVQIKAAEERLQETREMVPYVPPALKDPEEPDLGEELKNQLYKVSENVVYDGSKQETALICWMRQDTTISDALLQEIYDIALKYQQENAKNQESEEDEIETPDPSEETRETSSASDIPDSSVENQQQPDRHREQKQIIPVTYRFGEGRTERKHLTVGAQPGKVVDAYTHHGKTHWLKSAKRISDGMDLLETDLIIDAYPQEDCEEQAQWKAAWEEGIDVEYTRNVSFLAKQMQKGELISFEPDTTVQAEIGSDIFLQITSEIHDLSKEYKLQYQVTPSDGVLKSVDENGVLILTGRPERLIDSSETYTVKAAYTFEDNYGQSRAVEESFSFSLSVIPRNKTAKGEFYVVFKATQDNFLEAAKTVWQGTKVIAYEDGSFDIQLYDASAFADHTLPVKEEIEVDLPEIDPNAMYTAEQILEMQKQCYATIKEQNEKLKMAESEYEIMQRELGDGNIYAEIDGKVVSLLTEDEAREQKQPLIKVSGGGGFYIEGSVSELEKEKLKLGQEVTINDWNSGGTYTGEVISIGDFPSDNDNWNGMGNPTASYYPFKAFVGEEADLQSGSYVSMSYSTASAERGIYLEKAFVRTDKDGSYIFVRGADGKLEKRSVRVGKVLWGSYYEILSSLGEEDFLAFPYGKNVKQGAPTVESDLSTLYTF